MINQKYQHLVFVFFMTLLMSGIMSLVITGLNLGFVGDILLAWLKAWGIAFAAAFPAAILISPIATKMMNMTIKRDAGYH